MFCAPDASNQIPDTIKAVPWIIDYAIVLERMREQRMRCHYYNSGAFGFTSDVGVRHVGWIGPDDPTIRQEARELAIQIPPPHEQNLAAMLRRAWLEQIGTPAWVMPKSHWAHELQHGSGDWMPALLEHIGIDAGHLAGRSNAAAIEFAPEESPLLEHFARRLLEMLHGSDFLIAFPRRPVICALHHHKQLWWSSSDEQLINELCAMRPSEAT